jgi:hypothetical protein
MLVDWLRFRRELGLLSAQDSRERLVAVPSRGRSPRGCDVAELLVESGGLSGSDGDTQLDRLVRYAEQAPPIAAALLDAGLAVYERAGWLAQVHARQDAWREELADQLRQAGGSVCLVGNSASLLGAGLAPVIAAHAGPDHRPGRRHAWDKEAEQLQRWIAECVASVATPP